MVYDDYNPCENCSRREFCDGWEAAVCLADPDDPEYDPFDI